MFKIIESKHPERVRFSVREAVLPGSGEKMLQGLYYGKPVTVFGSSIYSIFELMEQLETACRLQVQDENNNYGLAFYSCGYDGNAQNLFNKEFGRRDDCKAWAN